MSGKIYKVFFVIALFILVQKSTNAQEVPLFKDIKVLSNIAFDKTTGVYTYLYTIINPKSNTGNVENIQIDISKPVGGTSLSDNGLTIQRGINRKGIMLTRNFDEERTFVGLPPDSLIPIGSQPPTTGWSSGISRVYTISWGVRAKKEEILPGKEADGFRITSRGLPAIRSNSVRPDWILTVEGYVSEDDLEKNEKIEKEITFAGKTIGPTAPPADFQPIAFLDHIVSLKHQAYNLGWIVQGKDDKGLKDNERNIRTEETGIMKSLDEKLSRARERLEKGDNKEAVEKLGSFIHEVEALYKEDKGRDEKDKDKHDRGQIKASKSSAEERVHEHITSEAYALLKYNAQYLIDQLGGDKKRRGKDD